MTALIHEEAVRDRRSRLARLLNRVHHRHHAVRWTWSLDDTLWSTDPNALEFCECGARRPLWRGGRWLA